MEGGCAIRLPIAVLRSEGPRGYAPNPVAPIVARARMPRSLRCGASLPMRCAGGEAKLLLLLRVVPVASERETDEMPVLSADVAG